jgi:hypothetical protein
MRIENNAGARYTPGVLQPPSVKAKIISGSDIRAAACQPKTGSVVVALIRETPNDSNVGLFEYPSVVDQV